MLKAYSTLDRTFRALSDPARRSIVERLCRAPASVSELARPLPMSLPAVHQHLNALRKAGLMTWEKKGRIRWCRLETKHLSAAEHWIVDRRRLWERRLDALGIYLATSDKRARRSKRRKV